MIKIRKRDIIAILLSVTVLICTFNIWFVRKPIITEFDITGAKEATVEIELNRKDNNEFYRSKTNTASFKITEEKQHILIKNKTKKKIKRFRITISNIKAGNVIELKNIQLRHGKIKLNKLRNFTSEEAPIQIKDNTLLITPKKDFTKILYTESLKVKAPAKFIFELFITIFILSYLFFRQLLNYAADFSLVKHKSRIDIIFLAIFFSMLWIPMLNINNNSISQKENRRLANWKPLINQDGELNYQFGKNYESWFNDRFNGRDFLTNLYNKIYINITGKNDKGIYDKRTGIMYKNFELIIHNEDTFIEGINELEKFNKFCRQNNINLYVLITPPKPYIYPTSSNFNKNQYLYEKFNKYIENKNVSTDLKIVYPYKEFFAEKQKNYIYFKTEHHWTDDGAFAGYKALMKKINADYPEIRSLTSNDFNYSYDNLVRGDFDRRYNYGSTATLLNITPFSKYHTTQYRYYTHKDFDSLNIEIYDYDLHRGKYFYYPKGADYRVIMLGTSQNENLSEFIPFTFKNVKRVRNNNVKKIAEKDCFKIIKYHKDEILEYKPDIIVFCITYGNISLLKDLFNME